MAGTKIESAIQQVASAVEKTDTAGSLGIKGMLWNNVGNMAAMAIIAGAFLYLGQDFIRQSKEDRIMFRDELKNIRNSQEARWEKTDATHGRSMEKMGDTINRASASLESAVKELKEANRRNKSGDPGVSIRPINP